MLNKIILASKSKVRKDILDSHKILKEKLMKQKKLSKSTDGLQLISQENL